MKLTPSNAFVGAKITIGSDTKYVCKVNAKSFYAVPLPPDELPKASDKKFVDYMKIVKGEKLSYGKAEISDVEVARKDGFIEKEKPQKDYLLDSTKRALKQIFNEKVIGASRKSYKHFVDNGKSKNIVILEANTEGWFLISMRDGVSYFFYNVFSGEYVEFNREEHGYGDLRFPTLRAPNEKIEKTA